MSIVPPIVHTVMFGCGVRTVSVMAHMVAGGLSRDNGCLLLNDTIATAGHGHDQTDGDDVDQQVGSAVAD